METIIFFAAIGYVLYLYLEELRLNQEISEDIHIKIEQVDETGIAKEVEPPIAAPLVTDDVDIKVEHVKALFSALMKSENPPLFVGFIFTPPDSQANLGAINIQFSMEDGKPGFDWISFNDRNKEDEQSFMTYAVERGFLWRLSYERDDDRILRVENGALAALCSGVMTEMYSLPLDQAVELVTA